MCGRFSLAVEPQVLMQHFDLHMDTEEAGILPLAPRYNIAPSQPLLAVVASQSTKPGSLQRKATHFRWGLVPAWSKTFKGGWINARSETAAEKPSFRAARRRRCCLIPADGFYEWTGSGKAKQPYWIHLQERTPSRQLPVFAFAGIWERWQGPEGTVVDTCAILNTTANPLMQVLHERMPVILPPETYDIWLDPNLQDPKRVVPLLRPYPPEAMVAYPVSTHVNPPPP
ncbi:SOS response-associated peptidase [Synechococcus sp. Nb3U1]|uniref:SOS response-associated peptidase n=1 Tax=Synechococcus sp. Nb3U1 TaxID=1914529 RepID=UPI001F319041|nr:SOS response-associated peptidase [Synechococcus sp. Nb3U1]